MDMFSPNSVILGILSVFSLHRFQALWRNKDHLSFPGLLQYEM